MNRLFVLSAICLILVSRSVVSAQAQEEQTEEKKEKTQQSQAETPAANSLEVLIAQTEAAMQEEIARGLKSQDGVVQLTVKQALDQAWAFNIRLRAQRRSVEEANAERKAFYLQFVTGISIGTNIEATSSIQPYSRRGDVETRSSDWQTTVPYSASLGANVTLFDMSLLTRLSGLSSRYQNQLIEQEILRQSIAIKVIRQIYEVLKAQKRLESSHLNVDITEKYYGYAQNDYNNGRISRLEYLTAQKESKSSQANLLSEQFALARAQRTLNLLLGYVPQQQLEVAVKLQDNVSSLLDQSLPAFNPQMPELRQQELALRVAQSGLREAYLNLLPQFSITGSLSLNAFSSSLYRSDGQDITTTMGNTNLSSGISLTWDLSNFFPFSSAQRKVQQGHNQLLQAQENYDETLRQKGLEYIDGLQELLQNKKLLEVKNSSLAVAKEALREAELSYGRGLVSYDKLLKAQKSLEDLQDDTDDLVFAIMEVLLQLGGQLNLQYF